MNPSKARFCIVEINPYAPLEFVFSEVASSLDILLRSYGFSCKRNINTFDAECINIVFGASKLEDVPDFVSPAKVVLYNFEQLGSTSKLVNESYFELLSKYFVFDYHSANIDLLVSKGFSRDKCFEIPVKPTNLNYPNAIKPSEKKYDVCFVGSMSPRRKLVVDQLQAAGMNVLLPRGAYGNSLVPSLLQSRLILNIHYYETSLFPVLRLSQPIILNLPIVSEISSFSAMVDWGQSGIEFANYIDLPAACLNLLGDPDRQVKNVARNNAFIESIPFFEAFDCAYQKILSA